MLAINGLGAILGSLAIAAFALALAPGYLLGRHAPAAAPERDGAQIAPTN